MMNSGDVAESHGIFNFSEDLFDDFKKKEALPVDSSFIPRPIFDGWFMQVKDTLITRKFYFEHLYWKCEFEKIIQELPQCLNDFDDLSCIVRRELLDCLIRSYWKVEILTEAALYCDLLLSLEIVDLGSRLLAAEIYSLVKRLEDALSQVSLYLEERPTVYQAFFLKAKILFQLEETELAIVAQDRANSILNKQQEQMNQTLSL